MISSSNQNLLKWVPRTITTTRTITTQAPTMHPKESPLQHRGFPRTAERWILHQPFRRCLPRVGAKNGFLHLFRPRQPLSNSSSHWTISRGLGFYTKENWLEQKVWARARVRNLGIVACLLIHLLCSKQKMIIKKFAKTVQWNVGTSLGKRLAYMQDTKSFF